MALEYGLLLALVSIGAIVALQNLGLSLVGLYDPINDLLARVGAKLH